MEFNQNKADGGEKPWPWPREGPLLLETIIGGTLTLSRVLVSGNSAERALGLLRQLISQSRKSPGLVGEIKHRLGPVSDVGVIGAGAARL